jgi:phage shock protein C
MTDGFTRDRAHARILGVCAGLARRFGWSTLPVRLVAVLAICLFGPVTIAAYLILGWLAD